MPEVASVSASYSSATPWYRTVTPTQWRVLAAAKLGWMLDAMDFMLFAMAIGQLRAYFSMNDAMAGLLGTVTLAMSAVGGILFGFIADRVGRTRALMATVLIFSLASIGASTSQSIAQLLAWRAVLGIGMGGEWASGAVLVSETWPARSSKQGHQHHAVGVGDWLHHRGRRRRRVHRHAGAGPRGLAVALCLWCGARALRVVDTTVGAGTGGLDRTAGRSRWQ